MKNKYLVYGMIAVLLIGAVTIVEAKKKTKITIMELQPTFMFDFCYNADINQDGTVDLADFGILKANYGGSGLGDINKDGVVDLQDFGMLKAYYGRTDCKSYSSMSCSNLLTEINNIENTLSDMESVMPLENPEEHDYLMQLRNDLYNYWLTVC